MKTIIEKERRIIFLIISNLLIFNKTDVNKQNLLFLFPSSLVYPISLHFYNFSLFMLRLNLLKTFKIKMNNKI